MARPKAGESYIALTSASVQIDDGNVVSFRGGERLRGNHPRSRLPEHACREWPRRRPDGTAGV
jgi:hypothetical protein